MSDMEELDAAIEEIAYADGPGRQVWMALVNAKDRINELERALKYYADRQHPYCWDNPQFGDTARAALGEGDE